MTSRKQDLITAVSFIIIALLIVWVAIPHGVQEPKKVKFVALSPSYYPRLIGYALLLFGACLIVKYFLSSNLSTTANGTNEYNSKRLIPIALILSGLYFGLQSLGFVLAPAIGLGALLWLAGERNVWVILLMSIVLPLALYIFFTKVANIPIPGGVLDPILLKLQ